MRWSDERHLSSTGRSCDFFDLFGNKSINLSKQSRISAMCTTVIWNQLPCASFVLHWSASHVLMHSSLVWRGKLSDNAISALVSNALTSSLSLSFLVMYTSLLLSFLLSVQNITTQFPEVAVCSILRRFLTQTQVDKDDEAFDFRIQSTAILS